MTPGQVASVIRFVGPPFGTTVAEWVAKSRQESSHDPTAVNGKHIGLYQVNYELHAGKADLSDDPETARKELENPLANFNTAKYIYQESGWKPWNASGGKPTPTAEDRAAADNPEAVVTGVPDIVDQAGAVFGDVTEALSAIVDVVSDAGGWLTDRKNWGRIAFVAIGGVVIVTAMGIIAKPAIQDTVRPPAQVNINSGKGAVT